MSANPSTAPTQSLAASEMRYRRLFETARDGILILDGNSGQILDANPFIIDMLGYSLAELTGEHLWDLGAFEDTADSKRAFALLKNDGYVRYENLPLRARNGASVEVEFISNGYRVDDRNIIQCNVRDIRDRQRVIRALSASEVRYRRLFETAQDAILILNGDNGKIIDANPFVINLLGYELEELVGKELWEIGLFRDIEESQAAFRELHQRGYIRYEDLPLQTKNGKPVEVEFVSNSYKVEDENIIQCNIRDISDRKKAERAAQENAARFRFLAESMPQKIFTAKPDGQIDYFNQQWSEFTGVPLCDIEGTGWQKCIHPDDIEETIILWRASLRSGEPFEFQYRLRRADGIYRWHLARAKAMRGTGGNTVMWVGVTWVGSSTDIDDQKQVEENLSRLYAEAETLNRAKDEFLATVSHELRTPMTSILGWTTLLAGELDDATRREGLATIHRSARLQSRLIDDILDVARMVTGKVHLSMEPVDLKAVLRESLSAVTPAAEAKGIEIRVQFEAGLPDLCGDPQRLQQVFWNLLSNALKFTPSGGRIDVRLFVRDSQIIAEVQDSGEGISADFLPFAFDRFAQEEGGRTTRRHGGMGLGLSIVKQLVELHGGTVSVESAGEGRGATFTVTIPARPLTPAPTAPTDVLDDRRTDLDGVVPSVAGLRLLVIDDEPDSRRIITAILEHNGAVVTAAAGAREAFALWEANPFDVLLCDIAMPEEDGYALIRRLRAQTDQKSRIPAVALTAYGRPTERSIALAEGFNAYLKKPVEAGDLVSLVASVAGRNSRTGD